jgi:hypothetical protein
MVYLTVALPSVNVTAALIFWAYALITNYINRVLTLYIAFSRACVVFSIRQAQLSLLKTERDHVRDTVLRGGEFHDQGVAKWIVIRRLLWGHNDTPCGRPAPGRPIGRTGSGRPRGVFGGLSYY